ncbi:hypothetical protein ABMA27_011328 [Loxostege sticticalis]|uniref:Uncharacterized protein n=1 Tax=Loxostege sticticalis TaxID=481309 RepID=A0ABR3H261_LOXSC
MSFKIYLSTFLLSFNLISANYLNAASNYLNAASNYLKPTLERNNIVNKGIWVRDPKDRLFEKSNVGEFIFSANSLDVDTLLQNSFDSFGNNAMQDAPGIASYIERSKRSASHERERLLRESLKKCNGDKKCMQQDFDDKSLSVKSKLISKLKPTSVFNDYPYEVAILLGDNKFDVNSNNVRSVKDSVAENVIIPLMNNKESPHVDIDTIINTESKGDSSIKQKENNTITPKRSMKNDYESKVIKKIEITEELDSNNDTTKVDRDIFDKEERIWHQDIPISETNAYKIVPKYPIQKNKPINERGLIKVLSMLTKTFKKIMKQHSDIKKIHSKLHMINDEVNRNIIDMNKKFKDMEEKYSTIVTLSDKMKMIENNIQMKEEFFKTKETEMSKNLIEFENQQKKFLTQQRQFYNIQKLMLAQNEKINLKQNLIAKTQSEISHRQNNFARILKKAKQIYIDNKHTATKLFSSTGKPNAHNNETEEPSKINQTTTQSPISNESIKINLFSIPALNKLVNQDTLILKEKDEHPVDDLVYKYYFNNTFIDNLMKSKILSSFMTTAENSEIARNAKNKRHKDELETTILLPINTYQNEGTLNRERRWIHHLSKAKLKRKHRGKNHIANVDIDDKKPLRPKLENEIPKTQSNKATILFAQDKSSPFRIMAKNFCNEIGQNANQQMLNWCIEKALRRLQYMETTNAPITTSKPPVTNPTESSTSPVSIFTLPVTKSPVTTLNPSAGENLIYFPDNDELESNLKQFDMKPDTEGNVYYDGSLHASDLGIDHHMSRCDYDTIFQRVFCVTLVAIALTFTVILTNVFVDIDGLLSSKDKLKTIDVPVPVLESEIHEAKMSNFRPDTFYKEDKNYDEDNDENYRSKRSIAPNFLFHVKNPKIKSILTNRLTSLLEQLDGEENPEKTEAEKIYENEDTTKSNDKFKTDEKSNLELQEPVKSTHSKEMSEIRDEEDFLHLAMHNILLQGIIGHMDLNDVYKKVHSLLKNFKGDDDKGLLICILFQNIHPKMKKRLGNPSDTFPKTPKEISKRANPSIEENRLFEEMMKCDKLQDDITSANNIQSSVVPKEPKLLIKTIIDITSNNKDKAGKETNTNSKETIKGIIKLIYNGKSIKFSRMEDEENQQKEKKHEKPSPADEVTIKDIDDNPNEEAKDVDAELLKTISKKSHRKTSTYFKKIVDDYFKKYPQRINVDVDDRYNEKIETKRLKRQIKIRYETEEKSTTESSKPKVNEKDDDGLFVEIETHFDSKGLKGEKKKKLIRSLINKIQKAIHSDIDKFEDGKKHNIPHTHKHEHKHVQVTKRFQNPLAKKLLVNKIMLPISRVEQRHSDPISKAMPLHSPLPQVRDQTGENWKKPYLGPGFLTVSKSLNSAEMGEIDVDYNKIMSVNGIPQRLQKPLNTDDSQEMTDDNTFFDMGKLKFYVKNIDGTGLSIGFNQYTDEAPDPDSIKLFTGIEHLVNKYQNEGTVSQDRTSVSEEKDHQISRDKISDRKEHVMIRRSIQETREKDYHSNEYKIIFDHNFLPYNNYQEIYEDKKKRVAFTINKETENINTFDQRSNNVEIVRNNIEIKELPALIDENIFYKKLKPSEILSIASLLDRQKRSPTMHRITNLKKKMRVNRYLNTRPMGARNSKKIILNKKRSKRQIDKIRIIATDSLSKPRNSEDNIFYVNDENIFADRAIVREVETPDEVDFNDHGDFKQPRNSEDNIFLGDHYDVDPVAYEEPVYQKHMFEGRSRKNQLMSKYPHIFMEEVAKSKEDLEPIILGKLEIKPNQPQYFDFSQNYVTTEKIATLADEQIPKLEDLVKVIDPNQNFKVTVKILPKNETGPNGVKNGFKEIHATINKSFNRDGLRYSSLVNVTEVSKIENVHNTTDPNHHPSAAVIKRIKEQQMRMDKMLKQHKKKINEQLDQLTTERDNLDIIDKLDETTTEKRDVTTSKPDPLLQVNKDDLSKILALLQLHNKHDCTSTTQTSTSTTTDSTTTITTTPKPTTTQPTPTPHINTNDHINSEILNQINKNTEILQQFLQKLSDKFSKDKEPLRHGGKSEEAHPSKMDFIQRYWKPFPEHADLYQPPPPQTPYDARNGTQLHMPFMYAYPPPYPINNFKHHIPIASVVYHGHIHTDSLKRPKKTKHIGTPKKVDENNQTRYFIDDLEDFKVEPLKKDKSSQFVASLGVNLIKKSTTVKV